MKIAITTHDRSADFDLFATASLSMGQVVDLGSGVTVTYEGTLAFKAADLPSVIEVVVDVASNTTAGVAAVLIWEWLKGRLKKPPQTITIETVRVEFHEGRITTLIRETITRTSGAGD